MVAVGRLRGDARGPYGEGVAAAALRGGATRDAASVAGGSHPGPDEDWHPGHARWYPLQASEPGRRLQAQATMQRVPKILAICQ